MHNRPAVLSDAGSRNEDAGHIGTRRHKLIRYRSERERPRITGAMKIGVK